MAEGTSFQAKGLPPKAPKLKTTPCTPPVDTASDSDSTDGTLTTTRTTRRTRHTSFTDKRRHSQTLSPLIIPPAEDSQSILGEHLRNFVHGNQQPTKEQCVADSSNIFEHFLYSEIEREKLLTPEIVDTLTDVRTPEFNKNPSWSKYGRELRIMADDFAKTKERKKIKRRAGEIDMDHITSENFMEMLKELFFSGGVTQERLMVLFFFCSDLVIRSIKQKTLDLTKRFLQWSLNFIRTTLVTWVVEQGGWSRILQSSGRWITYLLIGTGAAVVSGLVLKKLIFKD